MNVSSADITDRRTSDQGPRLLDSATVILIRESRQGQFKVFIMCRHRTQDFMGGAYVFPGGRLEKTDLDPALADCASGLAPPEAGQRLQEPKLAPAVGFGLYLTAVRETFEEAGVLLARERSGAIVNFSDGETAGRFANYRLQLHDGSLSLTELAGREGLIYALDLLVPYSHWITPEVERKRFNTRFFLARHPAGQMPVHDTIEMTRSLWLTPAAALEEHAQGRILLMPPTLKTIEELSGYETIDRLFTAARSRAIFPILPEAFRTADGFGVRLPHDPEYSLAEYKQPARPEEPSRIIMKDGMWRTVRVKEQGTRS